MFGGLSHLKVYLAPGYTDMRKAINGLSILVDGLDLDPFSGHLFVFCNRRQTMLKILYWDRNGFCLWQKRLEKDRFSWPQSTDRVQEIDHRSLTSVFVKIVVVFSRIFKFQNIHILMLSFSCEN